MRYRVLGPLEVTDRSGERIAIRGPRQRSLLAALLVRADEVVPPDVLLEAVWGADFPKDPPGALQTQMSRLRTALGDEDAIVTEEAGYRLRTPAEDLDAARFEELVADGRSRLGADPHGALERFDGALGLWRGPAYAEVADRPLAEAEASRLERMRLTVTEDRAEALVALARFEEAVEDLEGFCTEHPLRERARGLLMRAHYGAGRQAEALETYRAYRDRLADELGVDPGEELRSLEVGILRQELEGAPRGGRVSAELRAPVAVTSFVGRETDLGAVVRQLEEARIVTITGPGGVGKTRLALEVARETAERYPDGVAVLETGSVGSDRDVGAALASLLEVQHRAGVSVEDRIVEVLRHARALLVFDNCEHVLEGAARLASHIVTWTAEVDVLVTSREPLDVHGEHLWPLKPLPVDGGLAADLGAAVRLFCDRARASAPGADPASRSEVVREVCRTLDGLPLSLELAAAQLRVMSLDELREVLAERTDVLSARRGAAPRHRSLDASIGWSYDLLAPDEQCLFERLSVFAGPFDRDAAAQVAAGDGVSVERVAPLLLRLVDRSMVVRHHEGRYGLLETMRRYGRRRLSSGGLLEGYEDRHTRYVLELVRGAEERLPGPREGEAYAAVDRALPELRAGHTRLLEGGGREALSVSASLHWYAYWKLQSEVHGWAAEAAEAADGDDPLLPPVLASAAVGAWQRGELVGARRFAQRGIDEADRVGCPEAARRAWSALGDAAIFEGRTDEAAECFVRARELAAAAGDEFQAAVDLCNEAIARAYAGDVELAQHLAEEGMAEAERTGSPTVRAWAAYAAGESRLEVHPQEAGRFLDEAMEVGREVGDRLVWGVAGLSALTVKARYGEPREALRAFPALIEHWRRTGTWTPQWTTLRNLIELLVRISEDRAAGRLYGAMLASETAGEPFGAEAERLGRSIGVLRERLGEDGFSQEVAAGRELDDGDALELALRTVREVSGSEEVGWAWRDEEARW